MRDKDVFKSQYKVNTAFIGVLINLRITYSSSWSSRTHEDIISIIFLTRFCHLIDFDS